MCIKQATGLPPSLSHFVFCQYQFWNQHESEVVAPVVNNDYPVQPTSKDSMTFKVSFYWPNSNYDYTFLYHFEIINIDLLKNRFLIYMFDL